MTKENLPHSRDRRKWRIELPNLYDDMSLKMAEFRLLVHYVRVGKCWESIRTTAKKWRMSIAMISIEKR